MYDKGEVRTVSRGSSSPLASRGFLHGHLRRAAPPLEAAMIVSLCLEENKMNALLNNSSATANRREGRARFAKMARAAAAANVT